MSQRDWEYIVYVYVGPPTEVPPLLIQPPEGVRWTLELIEQWLKRAKHAPATRINVDRRPKGGGYGPFPGTTSPFLPWRAYQCDQTGAPVRMSGP